MTKRDVYPPYASGTFPLAIGRLHYAIGVSPALKHMEQPAQRGRNPSWYDIIALAPPIMKMVNALVGVDRVATGNDFPQLMEFKRPVDFIDYVAGLTRREREMILIDNPARLLKIA